MEYMNGLLTKTIGLDKVKCLIIEYQSREGAPTQRNPNDSLGIVWRDWSDICESVIHISNDGRDSLALWNEGM